VNPLLRAAEAVYMSVNGARRWLYRQGMLQGRRLPRPVVSIGNITAGGAGKTPAVIALANALTARGIRPAVLTRGYGRPSDEAGVVRAADPDRYGDEPVLIKMNTNNVDVIVGKKRYENATEYLRENSCDIFILDDGFQHLQLHRDLDIVIDAPGSFHRERRSALRHAGIVISRRLTIRIPKEAAGRPLFAFAGLASPQQFFDSLRASPLVDLRGTLSFPDHHRYTPADLERVRQAAQRAGAEVIVTTEKDAVKTGSGDIIAIPAEFTLDREVVEQVAALVPR
jgi:tetraacyldisaccharide 4'-kinase